MKNLSANSYFNGISFSNSKKHARAIVNKNGTYQIFQADSSILTLYEKIIIWFYIITSIFIILFSILKTKNIKIVIGNFIFCLYFYLHIISFISGIFLSIFKPEFRKFHSAEHKIINFLKKYDKIPTLQEAKNESRFCTTCTSIPNFFRVLLGITWLLLLYSSMSLLHAFTLFIFLYLIIHFLYRTHIFILLQLILTSPKCEDKHILIGISVLNNVVLESKQSKQK